MNMRFLLIKIFFAVLFSAVILFAGEKEEVVLPNPAFGEIKDGVAVNWSGEAVYDEEIKETGAASLKMTGDRDWSVHMHPETVPLVPNSFYKVVMKARRTPGAGMNKYVNITEYDTDGRRMHNSATVLDWDISPRPVFSEVTGYFVTGGDTSKGSIGLNFRKTAASRESDTWWIDSIKLYKIAGFQEVPVDTPELFTANPGFEGGITSYGNPTGVGLYTMSKELREQSFSLVPDEEISHTGQQCLRLSMGGSITLSTLNVSFPYTYRVSIYAKGNGELSIHAFRYPQGSNINVGARERLNEKLTPEWQQYTLDFTVEHPLIDRLVPVVGITGSGYLDDPSIRVVPRSEQ